MVVHLEVTGDRGDLKTINNGELQRKLRISKTKFRVSKKYFKFNKNYLKLIFKTGSDSILPAAAVLSAATAFGLVSLLPLNVPPKKPLMYCNGTEVAQSHIKIDNLIYSCAYKRILISCSQVLGSLPLNECLNKTMDCDDKKTEKLYCTNGTLVSNSRIVCNSTTAHSESDESLILHCYFGAVHEKMASFIPTTTTEEPISTTTEVSLGQKFSSFFSGFFGGEETEDIDNEVTTTIPSDETELYLDENYLWVPEPLTIPPEIPTTTESYVLLMEVPGMFDNGTKYTEYRKVYKALAEAVEKRRQETGTLPPYIFKVPASVKDSPSGIEKYRESLSNKV